MAKDVTIAGIPVTIIADEEAETVDYVVCAPDGASPFTDNFKGTCCKCGCAVMYRWHAPRKPAKICLECVTKLAQAESK